MKKNKNLDKKYMPRTKRKSSLRGGALKTRKNMKEQK